MEQAMTFETSASTEKLDACLAKAQGAFRVAAKDKINPHFKSKYADLASVWDACRDALAANGVSVTQWPVHSDDGRLHLVTRLAASGEWIMAHFSMPVGNANAHGYGSALTYIKRFALAAALGIAADDDDDGNSASNGHAPPPKPAAKPAPTLPPPPTNTNGAMPNGANDEAAETFTAQSIEQLGKMKHVEGVEAWVRKSERHLEKLKAKYPDLHERLMVAVEEQRGSLPHVTEAA